MGEVPRSGGTHSGLHRRELHVLLAARGHRFAPGRKCFKPAGLIDLAPTVLETLYLGIPARVEGRSLLGKADHDDEPASSQPLVYTVADGSYVQSLGPNQAGDATFLDRGTVGTDLEQVRLPA